MTRTAIQDPPIAREDVAHPPSHDDAAPADTGQHYRALYDALPVAAFACNREGAILHHNRRAAELWQRGTGTGIGRHYGQLGLRLPDGSRLPLAHGPLGGVLRTGIECRGVEVSIERTDGSRLPGIAHFSPLEDTQGHVTAVLATFDAGFDGTRQQSELEQVAAQSERQSRLFDTILSNVPDLLYVFDLDHRFVYANPALLATWGLSLEQALGRTCLELGYEPWHAEMHDREIDQVIATRLPVRGEVPFTGMFGRRDYEYIFVPVLGADGEVEAIAGTTRDTTERKRGEEALLERERRLIEVFEAAPAFMAVVRGPDLVFENANPAYSDLVGRERELIGKPLLEALPEIANQPFAEIIRGVMETGEAFHGKGVRILLKRSADGALEERWLDFVYEPLGSPDGSISGVLAHGVDQTERVVAEAALRSLADELSDAARRKDEFLATLAHELRNPLAPISNALQVLRLADRRPEIVQALFPVMERQVGQLVRLVDDLLDVSRISRGRLELRRTRIDLASSIGDAVETCQPLIDRMQHTLAVDLPPEPLYVDADPTRLAQVFGNLLTNACKFTDPRGRIAILVEREDRCAVIRVRDNGIGIAADELERIFDAFTQVDTSLERSVSGLGIGLSLVQSLVQKHGGTVEVHSAGVGHGSQFTVRLPCAVERGPG